MEEQLILFETAKLAKEKGFFEGYLLYNHQGKIWRTFLISDEEREQYSAVTQSLLQKWLREVHNFGIFISWSPNDNLPYSYEGYFLDERNNTEELIIMNLRISYHSYEEALEQGLQEALKLIPPK